MDRESLKAIGEMLRQELDPIREDISELRKGQDQLRVDVNHLREGQDQLRADVNKLQEGQERLEKGQKEIRETVEELEPKNANRHLELQGSINDLRKDLTNVEIITSSNWNEIAKLKQAE